MQGPIGRRRNSRPGLSGLVAGLFVFAMLFTVGTGFFIFVNTVNTTYDKGLSDRTTAMQAQLTEGLSVSTAVRSGHLIFDVENTGAVDSNVTDLLVVDPGGAIHDYGLGATSNTSPGMPDAVNVGATSPWFDTGLTVVTGTYTLKVLTELGNDFAASYPPQTAPEISTLLSSSGVGVGGSVYDTSSLSGVTSGAGGNVTYGYFSGPLCGGSATLVSNVVVVNATVPDSSSVTFNTVGSYSWQAVYTGDRSNSPATSACEPLAVGISLNTALSPAYITAGGSTHDTASLSGVTPSAGGTASYYYSASNQCPNGGSSSAGTVTVTSGSVPASNTVTFNTAGAYYFYATYSGDSKNTGPVTSGCELLIVQTPLSSSRASPSLATALSVSSGTPSLAGTPVTDSATISGGNAPTGVMVFAAYPSSSCTGAPAYVSNPLIVNGDGTYVSTPAYASQAVGTFYWEAAYLGDSSNNPYTTGCAADITAPSPPHTETLTVSKAAPSISTQFANGGSIFSDGVAVDTATLSSDSGTDTGGTVSYSFYSGSSCSGSATLVSTVTVSGGVVPSSSPHSFNLAGPYSFQAVYSGDANNLGATSPCEPLTVSLPAGVSSVNCAFSCNLLYIGNSYKWYDAITDSNYAGSGYLINGYLPFCCSSALFEMGTPVSTQDIAIQMSFVNNDPAGLSVTISPYSYFEYCEEIPEYNCYPSASVATCNPNQDIWFLTGSLSDNSGDQYVTPASAYTPITVPFGQSVSLIFGSSYPSTYCPNATPNALTGEVAAIYTDLIGTDSSGNTFGEEISLGTTSFTQAEICTSACTLQGTPGSQVTAAISTGGRSFAGVPTVYWVNPDSSLTSLTCTCTTSSITFTLPSGVSGGYHQIDVTDGAVYAYGTVYVQAPDYSVSVSPSGLSMKTGQSAQPTVTVSSLYGFTGTVSLSASVSPSSGLTASLNPSSVTLGTSGTSTLSLTSTAAGTYTVTITGTSGSVVHTATVTVLVVNNAGLDPNSSSHTAKQSNGAPSGTQVSLSVTTTNAGDLVYACEFSKTTGLVLSLSDSAGLSWTSRTSSAVTVSGTGEMQCWYAFASGTLSGDSVNLAANGNTGGVVGVVFSVSGVSSSQPFDPNVANAVSSSGTGTTASVTVPSTGNTGNSNDLIVGIVATSGKVTFTAGSGFSSIDSTGAGPTGADEFKAVSTTGSYTASYSIGSSSTWIMFGDAIDPPLLSSTNSSQAQPASGSSVPLNPRNLTPDASGGFAFWLISLGIAQTMPAAKGLIWLGPDRSHGTF